MSKNLFSLLSVLVEAGILEDTGFGGYKVAIDIPAMEQEVELLRRKVKVLENKESTNG